MITVKKPKKLDQYRKLLKEFPKRLQYSMDRSLEIIAEEGKDFIKSRIPDLEDNEGTDYKDSLVVKKINSPNKNQPLTAIVADTSGLDRKLSRDVKPQEDVIYIIIKKMFKKRAEPWMTMLESLSPWTIDTLPYLPSEKEADILYRRVTKQETDSIRKTRRVQQKYIDDVLRKSGIRPEKTFRGKDLDIAENERAVVPDFAFNALRMEFGLGKERSIPHWRPMKIRAKMIDVKKIAKDREILDSLTNPDNKNWKKRSQPEMTINEATELTKFQDKIK